MKIVLLNTPLKKLNADEWPIVGPQFSDKNKFCTKNPKGEGICVGDAGAPLVVGDVVIGVASFNYLCGIGYPDFYTNVYAHLKWIRRELTK